MDPPIDVQMTELILDDEEEGNDEEKTTFNDLGEGYKVYVIVGTGSNRKKIRFHNYEIQTALLDIKEEDKIVKELKNGDYSLEVDITLEYAELLLQIVKRGGIKVDSEQKKTLIEQQIEINRGRRYFSPNANLLMGIGIARYLFKLNPLSIRDVFNNPNHPFMAAEDNGEELLFVRLIRKDTLPYIADIDFTNHNMIIRLKIMSDVCHYLSGVRNSESRRENICSHIFSVLSEKGKSMGYIYNSFDIFCFTESRRKYGTCSFFLAMMVEYMKTVTQEYREDVNKYIIGFRQ